jgi:hypothetical protein
MVNGYSIKNVSAWGPDFFTPVGGCRNAGFSFFVQVDLKYILEVVTKFCFANYWQVIEKCQPSYAIAHS